ncbi:hypothetical protein EniLVp02_0267 [Vibrio phage EniLVp02]
MGTIERQQSNHKRNDIMTSRDINLHGNTINAIRRRGWDVELWEREEGEVALSLYDEDDSEPLITFVVTPEHMAYELQLSGAYMKQSVKEELPAFTNVADLLSIIDYVKSEDYQ